MGEPKASLRLPDGDTFIARIARELMAGGAAPVLVVVSAHTSLAQAEAACPPSTPVRCIINPEAERGQLSSLQCGLAAVADAPAVVLTLVDVPLVTGAVVHALIEAWAASGAPLVRPTRAGRHGHPIVIAQPLIGELLAADRSSTTRDIVRHHAANAVELEVEEDGPFLDVDTPEEYRRLISALTAGRRPLMPTADR
jgi:molybdenum cofactor cytidylyltransferase